MRVEVVARYPGLKLPVHCFHRFKHIGAVPRLKVDGSGGPTEVEISSGSGASVSMFTDPIYTPCERSHNILDITSGVAIIF